MNPLSPKQAANIASHVYSIRDAAITQMSGVQDEASRLGLGEAFDFAGLKTASGTSGAIIRQRTGFAYAVNGTGTRQGEMLLAFRGTASLADTLTDLNIGLQRGPSSWRVHAGFNETFKSMREEIDRVMRGRNPSVVHCVGHSLGGALAGLAADHLSEQGGSGIRLYSFGAPRVGVSGFAHHLTEKIGQDNIQRVYHTADPVSMIPIYPYAHAPDAGQVCELSWPGGIFAPSAHFMANYQRSVGDVTWEGLQRAQKTTLDRDIEIWLETANGSVLMLSATSLWMISRALQYLLKKTLNVVAGSVLTLGFTLLDQVAELLVQGARACKAIGEALGTLITRIFRFLGKPMPAGADLSTAFLRWVLDLLTSTVIRLARQAVQSGTRL